MADQPGPDDLVHVIITAHRHEGPHGVVEDSSLNAAQGWFSTREAAQARVDQLDAVLRRAHAVDQERRAARREAEREAALQLNREAAILRDNGVDKADVPVPDHAVPQPFEDWVAAKVPVSTHRVESLTRSEHDALVASS